MFTGIVQTLGKIMAVQAGDGCKTFTILPALAFHNVVVGESVAINGVCLTITHFTSDSFQVTAVPETLALTNLIQLEVGASVNIERALQVGDRMGGHFVQGHVDAVGQILALEKDGDALLVRISISPSLSKYLINKGFITLDGMSITIIEAKADYFTVTFIPHTQNVTIIPQYKIGSVINIEVDATGKYIEKLMGEYAHAREH